MARTTTRSRAAAISTAAVGLSPKIVVRSVMVERGSAEAPSSRRSVLALPLTLPLAPLGVDVVTDDDPVALPPDGGGETDEDSVEPLALLPAPPEGVLGEAGELPVLPLLWASVSAAGAASTAAPSRAISKNFIPHLLEAGKGARRMPVTGMRTPTGRCR
jgi:hypothetical protein